MFLYRWLSLAVLAAWTADKRVHILTLLPNTHSVISVQFLSPISCNVSSVRTWRQWLTFLFFTEPVSLNLLACLLIVLGLGTCPPGNFTWNLRRVSEHNFLLFMYVLWIYTCSHKLATLAQMVACLPLVQEVQGSTPRGVVNFYLKIFNLRARRGGDVHFLIARLYITVLD